MALVVNGPLVKEHVKIVKINKEEDYCEAEVASGEHKGKKVRKMYYDDICKESAAFPVCCETVSSKHVTSSLSACPFSPSASPAAESAGTAASPFRPCTAAASRGS